MTDLNIVNRALKFIGEAPADSMADTSRAAVAATSVYDTCRDEVLRMAPWTCCFKRRILRDTAEQATPWTNDHYYGVGERVTNDSSKTYICTDAGRSGTAASGGPTGSGTDIEDGSCTWDYVEVSTALVNWCHWVSTIYTLEDLVSWNTGKIYSCKQAGTSASSNPPVGIGDDIVDGTIRWAYYTTIPYNSTVYAYQYVLPPDCLRVIKVPDSTALKESDQGVQYSVEGKFLYTDQADSILKYVYRAPVSEWDALLQGTVAARIAAEIAKDVTGQVAIMNQAFSFLNAQYAAARVIAMGEAQEGAVEVVGWQDV